MGLFDDLLTQVEESDRTVFQKYPKVSERINQLDTFVSGWEKWRTEQWDDNAKMTKASVAALQAKDSEIEALKAMAEGNDMTWDDLKGNVQKSIEDYVKTASANLVTRDQFKQDFEKELNPRTTIKDGDREIPITEYVKNLATGIDITYFDTVNLPVRHFKEFGEVLEMRDLIKHMQEKGINKYKDAYESYVSPLRATKAEELAKQKEVDLRKQVREETLKEVTMKQGAMPLDDKSPAPQMTALQLKIADRKKQEHQGPKLTPGELGSNAGASDAYQAYLADQASGKVQ